MRGKIAKECRKIANRYSTCYNDAQTLEKQTTGRYYEQRVLNRNSTKSMVKRIKQLLDFVPHTFKRSVMNTLELQNEQFTARMR